MSLAMLTGLGREEFNREYRGKQCFVGRTQMADVAGLMSWRQVNHLLDSSDRLCEAISLVRGDARLDRRLFLRGNSSGPVQRLSSGAVRRALRDGYSLLLDQVHQYHLPVRRLCEALTTEVGEYVGVNVYVSWLEERCFNTHWDEHDVFIFQTEGEKHWTVFEPTRPNPVPADVDYERESDGLKVAWNGNLRPGDVLYIPTGWWHHARSTGAGSVHMTAGFRNQTGLDLLDFLSTLAAQHDEFRASVPRLDAETFDAASEAFVAQMKAFIDIEVGRGLLTRFWRDRYGSLPAHRQNMLPELLDYEDFKTRDYRVECSSVAPLVHLETDDDMFKVEFDGRVLTLDARAYPIVSWLVGRDTCSLGELAELPGSTLEPDEARALVFELLNEGFANLVDTLDS